MPRRATRSSELCRRRPVVRATRQPPFMYRATGPSRLFARPLNDRAVSPIDRFSIRLSTKPASSDSDLGRCLRNPPCAWMWELAEIEQIPIVPRVVWCLVKHVFSETSSRQRTHITRPSRNETGWPRQRKSPLRWSTERSLSDTVGGVRESRPARAQPAVSGDWNGAGLKARGI